jgi:hypothetical protein
MASYGVFLAACGFEYHGPKGRIGFTPRLTPENFKAAFTSAEGWGTFSQKIGSGRAAVEIAVKWGTLRVQSIALGFAEARSAKVAVNGAPVAATSAVEGDRLVITLAADATLGANDTLEVTVG